MRNHGRSRAGRPRTRLQRGMIPVSRAEVFEVMRRGGYTSPTAALRRLFPAMARYWSRGTDFVILTH